MNYKIVAIAISSFQLLTAREFSLQQLKQYAEYFPEHTQSKHIDWIEPDYTEFWHAIRPSIFTRMAMRIGLSHKYPWLSAAFFKQLDHINKQLKEQKNLDIKTISAVPNTTFYCWGGLHGAWHSLIRTLLYLHQEGVINEQLKIVKPNCFFIFLPYDFDRSPYGLETFFTVIQLLHQNPEQVILLHDLSEDSGVWVNKTLGKEVMFYATSWQQAVNNLFPQITHFFDSLSQSVVIRSEKNNGPAIIMGNINSINDHGCTNNLKNESCIDGAAINALILSDLELAPESKQLQSLTQANFPGFATSWMITSSPTDIYQLAYRFDQDVFVEINIKDPFKNSVIRAIIKKSQEKVTLFKPGPWHNIFLGQPINGDSAKEAIIKTGSTLGLSQGLVGMSKNISTGMTQRFIEENNKKNPRSPYVIKFTILDDRYDPTQALKNIEQFIARDIKFILLSTGSPTLAKYLSLVEQDKISVFFPATGAPQFRDEKLKNIIHLRASYADEVEAIVKYLIEKKGIKKFAFFYQNDAYGLGPLKKSHEILKKNNITKWTDIPYNKWDINFAEKAEKLKKAEPEAVGFFAISSPVQELVREVGNVYFMNRLAFGLSFVADVRTNKFFETQGMSVLYANVFPNPQKSNLPIVKEYRVLMDKHGNFYDIFSLEGYIGASVFIDALNHIEPPYTRHRVMERLESYKNYDFKGLKLTFDPKTRSLLHTVWLNLEDNQDWIETAVPGSQQNSAAESK